MEIAFPMADKAAATTEIASVLTEREKIIRDHEAHSCIASPGFTFLRSRLDSAEKCLTRAVNEL